ncbi:MAG: hypothetical protein K1X68_03700 [Saprospiraceae bacterium]|nr:hypothetical protein [Saprospiraceae bacterium]HMW40105.1 hypothetical protein [Saprospiraceae bacterium]HMX88884.1 hypothetical protein [Saprospiraceae bacterium]HMZ40987.1 hypothetical protein [Saprospiraceae bacterium]HNA64386.1 hypothetical protein [Saprospiraceae bacterium]
MTNSSKSAFYFGIYLISTGLVFILIPDTVISLMQLPAIPEGWGRMIGLLAAVIGIYYIVSGKANAQSFIKSSIYVRFGFLISVILLYLTGQMPVSIIIFGLVDALGAVWTAMALKSETPR